VRRIASLPSSTWHGQGEAARACITRAAGVFERRLGPDHPHTNHPEVAITLTNLASVQQQLVELEAARACIGRATGIFQRRLGPDHPHTKEARSVLESLGG